MNIPISISNFKQSYMELEYPSLASINDNTDWNVCPRFPYMTDL